MRKKPWLTRLIVIVTASSGCNLHRAPPDTEARCEPRPAVSSATWRTNSDSGAIQGMAFSADSLPGRSRFRLSNGVVRVTGPVRRDASVDSAGRFRISELPAGVYVVQTRSIGFEMRTDTLQIMQANGLDGQIRLQAIEVFRCCTPVCL